MREELKDYNHNEKGKMWHSRSYFLRGQNDGGAFCIIVLDTNHYQQCTQCHFLYHFRLIAPTMLQQDIELDHLAPSVTTKQVFYLRYIVGLLKQLTISVPRRTAKIKTTKIIDNQTLNHLSMSPITVSIARMTNRLAILFSPLKKLSYSFSPVKQL